MCQTREKSATARRVISCVLAACAMVICLGVLAARGEEARPKKVVLIAGTVHQGPGGHPAGTHEYELSVRLLKRSLETATNIAKINVEIHFDGWPRDPKTLDDADTIVVLSDGADRNDQDHPLLVGDRLAMLKRQMDRGCGLVAIHWTVFIPQKHGDAFLEWMGGYFDYQSGNTPNKWFSKIQTAETRPEPASADHPISRGLKPFALREEYYYNIRFRPNDPRLVPILKTPIPGESAAHTVAWAVERTGGGRGFGFTGGHFFDNWNVSEFRRMVLNAILWTAHAEVPTAGVEWAPPPADAATRAADRDKPIQALIVTGHQHPAHLWRDTTVALQEALSQERRFQITVVNEPEFLADKNLLGYDMVALNYCNWQRDGLSDASKANFVKYLSDGGGLVLVHFSNGAFHPSLPETPPSDWPEYRKICRRVWNHGTSGHDPYGRFRVSVTADHPITEGLNSFDTIDELYCNQAGDLPIEVLATAHSTVSGKDEPMAFVYEYGKGRVFQTVLGHAAESIRVPGAAALIRRGAVWAARRDQAPQTARTETPEIKTAAPKLAPEGRFGAALDPRAGAAWAERREAYDKRPLTVECWAKLNSKSGFNILVANSTKESADHWEIYTYAGGGDFSLYLPGFAPAEIRSGVDIADGRWHHVAAAFDETQARLHVDGKLTTSVAIKRTRNGGPPAALFFGAYPPGNIGCDGLVDEVRITNGLLPLDALPSAPQGKDDHTLGLWRFDRIENDRVEDLSRSKNPVVAGASLGAPGPILSRRAADSDLKLVTIDTSPDESLFSLRADTMGRLFVGGREALFVYEPDDRGSYRPRQLLYRFPPDTWLTDIAIRGDDVYVMTNAALYVFEGARTRRDQLVPKRLIWGAPVDLHVTYHGLAWGPEGDLYFSSGDPLLNYGDFASRPDHWGHWNVYTQPPGTKVPYTGMGGFFRCRPDGSGFQVVAGGTRGAVGIAFDRRWNLFSNDNDHESIADRYSPARLLHVAPKAHFFWPRGWIASMSPERSDLLEIVNTNLGREVPVGQAYCDEPLLGDRYRDSLLLARWGQRKVDGFQLIPRGASFAGRETPVLAGAETARPVGVTVGRGGRLFIALSYMAGNEWSPKYPSELVMLVPADDPPTRAFEPYDAPSVPADRLWRELSNPSWSRREQAHVEILRRDGGLLVEAISRLKKTDAGDPAMAHLPWLAGASGTPEARGALELLAGHGDPSVRVQAVRALAEFRPLKAPHAVFAKALADTEPSIQHAALLALFDRDEPLPEAVVTGPGRSADTYLRQAATFLLAARAKTGDLQGLMRSDDPAQRLAGVLATGFRLTVPPAVGEIPAGLPLRYESTNAKFVIDYADATIDLKKLGPVGSFTAAERWSQVARSDEEKQLFESLVDRLNDADDRVGWQAGYFLSLLNDRRAEPLVAKARSARALRRLERAPVQKIDRAWVLGPLDDGSQGFDTVHPPEKEPIDLSSVVSVGSGRFEWKAAEAESGFPSAALANLEAGQSSYYYFRLMCLDKQQVLLRCALSMSAKVKLRHNGRSVDAADGTFLLSLESGSNDLLVRVAHAADGQSVSLSLQSRDRVEIAMPEKLGLATLAQRLSSASSAAAQIPAEFLNVDWASKWQSGNAERGRKLFSADALGCAKCHAIQPNHRAGGGPSLAGAAQRFTVAHLVESILVPDRQVAPIFASTTIVTDDGRNVSGLVVEENERELALLLPTAARQVVEKSSIELRKTQPTSPMPSGLVKTASELADLLAYLLSANPQAP
jgi:putative heme-binding domain-containing protein